MKKPENGKKYRRIVETETQVEVIVGETFWNGPTEKVISQFTWVDESGNQVAPELVEILEAAFKTKQIRYRGA